MKGTRNYTMCISRLIVSYWIQWTWFTVSTIHKFMKDPSKYTTAVVRQYCRCRHSSEKHIHRTVADSNELTILFIYKAYHELWLESWSLSYRYQWVRYSLYLTLICKLGSLVVVQLLSQHKSTRFACSLYPWRSHIGNTRHLGHATLRATR